MIGPLKTTQLGNKYISEPITFHLAGVDHGIGGTFHFQMIGLDERTNQAISPVLLKVINMEQNCNCNEEPAYIVKHDAYILTTEYIQTLHQGKWLNDQVKQNTLTITIDVAMSLYRITREHNCFCGLLNTH